MRKTVWLLVWLIPCVLSCRLTSAVQTYGLVSVVYLPGTENSPPKENLDAWYREASWNTDLPARNILIVAGKEAAADSGLRGDSLPGGIGILFGHGDALRWKRIMGRSLFLSAVNPLARVFVPRWLVLGSSVLASDPLSTGEGLAQKVKGNRVVFENHRFRLDPGRVDPDEEALLSAGFFRYLTERYGEYRFYQYLNGAALDPGAAEGRLFSRMFGIDFTTALGHYCDYLSRGGRL